MLELKNIHKIYDEGAQAVRALKGIDLQFRKNEFVSILGPSGCGKTTMLNIIGGLDHYTEGDLIINGVSTKHYKDRDWDTYRNHSVGFVFQSYNLIPHQSVLANVELALTLTGVGRRERRERAKKVLEQVGLGDQLRKRPGKLSGGQTQRVAIARALVNNPDIILADEPTGALDTQTSVQVMEILKEVAKDRLVIMVTHNPELAEAYSTRIINMLDGEITGDSMPLTAQEQQQLAEKQAPAKKKKNKKPSMSLLTSFGLSLRNLFTKKGRTVLTSFAGSIGIIGIALIYAVSQGATTFINDVQEDTLTSYPLTIEASTVDIGTLMETFMGIGKGNGTSHEKDAVYSKSVLFEMLNAMNSLESTQNDLNAFKRQIEAELKNPASGLAPALSGVQYTYDMDLLVYTKDADGQIVYSNTEQLLMDLMLKHYGADMSAMKDMSNQMSSDMGMSMMSNQMALWNEMLSGKDGSMISPLLKEQYDVVYGDWPNSYDEIVLVLDENHELDDLTMFALGLRTQEEMEQVFTAAQDGQQVDTDLRRWSYEDIAKMEFRVVLNSDCYSYDAALGTFADLRQTKEGMRYLYDNAMKLRVAGIIAPDPDATSTMLRGSIGYTKALTEYVVEHSGDSEAVRTQMENPNTDIITGLPFKLAEGISDQEKALKFRTLISELSEQKKAQAYIRILSIPTEQAINDAIAFAFADATRESIELIMVQTIGQQMAVDIAQVQQYVAAMTDEELNGLYTEVVIAQVKMQTASAVQLQFASTPYTVLSAYLDEAMKTYSAEQCAHFYDEIMEFSNVTYEQNLAKLGYVRLDYPATVNLYASSFENKEIIEEFIAVYNASVDELKQIQYTDYVGLVMSSVTTIIDAITYVLIAFVAISLVVSSIMIGVITLISVQERTKEIGILRAIGASKRNVSGMFNAETVIIGFTSGALGVLLTYGLCLIINVILYALTDIPNLRAHLPGSVALVLIGISVMLTLISGIIPSRSAAKKDPVVALRTE